MDAQGSQGTSVNRDHQTDLRFLRPGKQFPASASELLLLGED